MPLQVTAVPLCGSAALGVRQCRSWTEPLSTRASCIYLFTPGYTALSFHPSSLPLSLSLPFFLTHARTRSVSRRRRSLHRAPPPCCVRACATSGHPRERLPVVGSPRIGLHSPRFPSFYVKGKSKKTAPIYAMTRF